jgi:hypothetical protein
MHQAVEEIIDRLIGAVKSDKPYYTLKDCLSAGFPSFIVERIRIEINEKLKKEFILHETEWANVEQPQVEDVWKDFQQALFANSRLPKDKFYKVISRVMNEIVKVYLEPRKHMAEYIYKGEDELTFNQLVERTESLTIYKHFGRAIPLYMNKRNLKTLDKNKCKYLIHNLDANLVSSYTATDWAKVLNLLFTLFGGKVDPKFIQLFFEDKGLYLTAKAFNELEEAISKEKFIEILSHPDLLNVKLQEKFRDKYRKDLYEGGNEIDQTDKEEFGKIDEKEQRLLDSFFDDFNEEGPQITDEESFNALFKREQKDKSIFEEFEESSNTSKKSSSLKEEGKSNEKDEFRKSLANVLDQAAHSFKSLSKEEQEEVRKESDTIKKEPDGESVSQKGGTEEEDVFKELTGESQDSDDGIDEEDEKPQMWQQFLRPDQMDILMGSKKSNSDETLMDEESLVDDLVDEDDSDDGVVPDLKDYMIINEGSFVEEIFKGSDKKYKKALGNIQELENWEEATTYIGKNVFGPNNVDMTSEIAIDFTDRLQSYFDEFIT